VTTGTLSVLPALYPKLNFKPAEDFQAISLFATAPNIFLVHPSVPANTLQEFLNYARSSKTPLHYGSSGNGGIGHLSMELLKQIAQIDMTHVPYKGTAPATADLLGGQLQVMFNDVAFQQINAGKLKALAVSGKSRSKQIPDVSTFNERGIEGYDSYAWFGVFVPTGTPSPIVDKLHTELAAITQDPALVLWAESQNGEMLTATPQETARFIQEDLAKWQNVVSKTGIVAE
jgi:tripartite-type tricarboxylate transporter receptor subunit TctC